MKRGAAVARWGRFGTPAGLFLLAFLASRGALSQVSSARRSPHVPATLGSTRRVVPTAAPHTLRTHLGIDVAQGLLKDPDSEQRQRAFERLSSVGTAQALDLLLKGFETGGAARSAQDRLIAVRALAPHASVPAVREFLVRIMVGVGTSPGRPEAIDGLIEQAAALALAGAGDDAALAALGKALRQPGHVADTAGDALLAFPPRSLQPIVQGLRSPTRAVVKVLAELGDERAIPALREIVRSAPNDLRPEAALALAHLGVSETVELARHWLKHETGPDFRLAAARILLEFQTPDAAAAVAQLLHDERSRGQALDLASRASLPKLTPALLQHARPAAAEEQGPLFTALGLAGSGEAFSFLGGALRAHETSSAAALALALSPGSEAEAVLEGALSRSDTRRAAVRAGLVRHIALDRTPSGFSSALRALSVSRDASDRALFFQASAAFSGERVPELLKGAGREEVRALARAALLPDVARALAQRLALEADPELREALAAGLVSLPAAELVPSDVLLDLLDAQGLAAPLAARALAARDSHILRPKILALLSSDDPLLRSHSALGLGQSQESSALGALERAYRFETDPLVRLAIVRGIAARHEPARARVLRLARTLDGSSAVREAAALALAGARPAPSNTGPQSAWLELRVTSRAQRDSAQAPRAAPPPAPVGSALLITAGGLALPAFADPDGVLLFSGLPTGPFELRLAAPTRTDDAPSLRSP